MSSSVILYLSFEVDSLTETGTHWQQNLRILLPLPAGAGITGVCCSADLSPRAPNVGFHAWTASTFPLSHFPSAEEGNSTHVSMWCDTELRHSVSKFPQMPEMSFQL